MSHVGEFTLYKGCGYTQNIWSELRSCVHPVPFGPCHAGERGRERETEAKRWRERDVERGRERKTETVCVFAREIKTMRERNRERKRKLLVPVPFGLQGHISVLRCAKHTKREGERIRKREKERKRERERERKRDI